MKTVVLACQTIYDELNLAIKETRCEYPVIWLDSEYHLDPDRLRSKLQQEIDSQKNVDNIILAYGFCGNAILGLTASTANLIFPKTDDCISLLLSKPGELKRSKDAYYLTRGWINSPRSFMMDYKYALERYGEEKAIKIFRYMLKNYNKLILIDTGAYNVADCLNEAQKIAEIAGLELIIEKGDLWLLKKMLTGPYDDNFCIVNRGEKVNIAHLGYNYNAQTNYQTLRLSH
ncbi:DUF1638 domain-containing protein [Thermosediminibacter oceani]|uniref:DUF1638 domain-containing protein n=1 Tax=Thermosediminibacter oceani (strain ATCC BAA-1034 / DSM 16646 / JW/IW-1228P) TaxID=555079 RepID=D9S2C5_THEOJ|nr:DUF1638 domain-containing protein [Thermosediminibacter oceani]ADL07552.1 protein of unknown function DUF1638 [Thermosediminibacter oceani DSM 16646]